MSSKSRRIVLSVVLASVFLASVYLATRPTFSEFLRIIAATPAIGSLCTALFVLLRDEIAYERKQSLLESQHTFSMGATSHMANVAFNKHVEFCEAYVAKMTEFVGELFRKGPHQEALNYSSKLYAVREKWRLWITPEMEAELEPFEYALRQIGADAMLLADMGQFDKRNEIVRKMYARYSEILGIKELDGERISSDRAVEAIIGKLRKVLGIEELTELRAKLVDRALENLQVKD